MDDPFEGWDEWAFGPREEAKEGEGPEVHVEIPQITEEVVVGDEPVEIHFASLSEFGPGSVTTDVCSPCWIVAGDGAHECPSVHSDEWLPIIPGVDIRQVSSEWGSGSDGYLEKDVVIRVRPEACPLTIRAVQLDSYEQAARDEQELLDSDDEGCNYIVTVVRRSGG